LRLKARSCRRQCGAAREHDLASECQQRGWNARGLACPGRRLDTRFGKLLSWAVISGSNESIRTAVMKE
jgi:hypothetical protein